MKNQLHFVIVQENCSNSFQIQLCTITHVVYPQKMLLIKLRQWCGVSKCLLIDGGIRYVVTPKKVTVGIDGLSQFCGWWSTWNQLARIIRPFVSSIPLLLSYVHFVRNRVGGMSILSHLEYTYSLKFIQTVKLSNSNKANPKTILKWSSGIHPNQNEHLRALQFGGGWLSWPPTSGQ